MAQIGSLARHFDSDRPAAEETGEGAPAMIKDGLFTRFPKPDFALAIHDSAIEPVGQVGFTPGYAWLPQTP